MLTKYDPDRAPDPGEWLALDELSRIGLVSRYHRKHRIKLPSLQAHAVIHAAVENQVALGDEIPVAATLRRLMAEGLDRHDAVHAIGSVLVRHMHQILLAETEPGVDVNLAYYRDLETLTARSWRASV